MRGWHNLVSGLGSFLSILSMQSADKLETRSTICSVMSFVGHGYPRPSRKEKFVDEDGIAEEDELLASPSMEIDEFNEY